MPKQAQRRDKVKKIQFIFFSYKTIVFFEMISMMSITIIKKTCVVFNVCGNSVGIPSNKMQE
jgi:hypothetical protein